MYLYSTYEWVVCGGEGAEKRKMQTKDAGKLKEKVGDRQLVSANNGTARLSEAEAEAEAEEDNEVR